MRNGPVHLFTPASTYRWRVHDRSFDENESMLHDYISYKAVGAVTVGLRLSFDEHNNRHVRFLDAGTNPDIGVVFYYALPDPSLGLTDASLQVRDGAGTIVRTITPADGLPVRQGLNRYVWDMRAEPPRPSRAPISMDSPLSQWLGSPAPLVLPGRYIAELSVAGITATAEVQLLPDPRVEPDEVLRDVPREHDGVAGGERVVR
jgi:hypothetical protein